MAMLFTNIMYGEVQNLLFVFRLLDIYLNMSSNFSESLPNTFFNQQH